MAVKKERNIKMNFGGKIEFLVSAWQRYYVRRIG